MSDGKLRKKCVRKRKRKRPMPVPPGWNATTDQLVIKTTYKVRPEQVAADKRSRDIANANRPPPSTAVSGQLSSAERAQRVVAARASAVKRRSNKPLVSRAPKKARIKAQSKREKALSEINDMANKGKTIKLTADKYKNVVAKAKKTKGWKVESYEDGSSSIRMSDGRTLKVKSK